MPKTAIVTFTVTVTTLIPKSWEEDEAEEKLTELINVDAKSSSKRVEVTDVEVDVDGVEVEEEEDD